MHTLVGQSVEVAGCNLLNIDGRDALDTDFAGYTANLKDGYRIAVSL